jgi:hypothetical protein
MPDRVAIPTVIQSKRSIPPPVTRLTMASRDDMANNHAIYLTLTGMLSGNNALDLFVK